MDTAEKEHLQIGLTALRTITFGIWWLKRKWSWHLEGIVDSNNHAE